MSIIMGLTLSPLNTSRWGLNANQPWRYSALSPNQRRAWPKHQYIIFLIFVLWSYLPQSSLDLLPQSQHQGCWNSNHTHQPALFQSYPCWTVNNGLSSPGEDSCLEWECEAETLKVPLQEWVQNIIFFPLRWKRWRIPITTTEWMNKSSLCF